MLGDIKRVKDRVEAILKGYKVTRDSDKQLWLAYCVAFCGLKDVLRPGMEYEDFKLWLLQPGVPMFESLSRARRMIQEQNPELAGKKEERMEEANNVKNYALQVRNAKAR